MCRLICKNDENEIAMTQQNDKKSFFTITVYLCMGILIHDFYLIALIQTIKPPSPSFFTPENVNAL